MKSRHAGFPLVHRLLPILAALLSGIFLWHSIRLCQGLIRPLLESTPEWLSLTLNAGIEEALRLSLSIAAAVAIRSLGLAPSLSSLAVLSSFILANLENADYLAVFPTLDAYWRLAYTMPIHMGAAALYALSTAPDDDRPASRRAISIGLSCVVAWIWHSSFNLMATPRVM
ncbi:hypothetical protein MASR2M48_12690 [Spirochaetota bacterium]